MDITIRNATYEDEKFLLKWLKDPKVLEWFPMCNDREIRDAVKLWISYVKYGAVLTALIDGIPCGIINLYLQFYQKLQHHSLFAIIVEQKYRGKKIGTRLIEAIQTLGKEKFSLQFLHLEVYENNPAMRLYERLGFTEFGRQKHFIKKFDDTYLDKIHMRKKL